MTTIKLTRDEQETSIHQTAQERIDGTINIYTDDDVWINRLTANTAFKDVSEECGISRPGFMFRSQNHTATVSLRVKRQVSDEQREILRERLLKAMGSIGKSDV